jgi:hypothetical protein
LKTVKILILSAAMAAALSSPASALSPECEKLYFPRPGCGRHHAMLCNADETAIARETSIIKAARCPAIKIDTESGPIGQGVRHVNEMFHAKGHLAVCGF